MKKISSWNSTSASGVIENRYRAFRRGSLSPATRAGWGGDIVVAPMDQARAGCAIRPWIAEEITSSIV